ncbi:MAG: hypothetical protein WDW38_007112 [Sanguina aurantia]
MAHEAVVPQFEEEEQQQEQQICTAAQPKQQPLEDADRASWAKDLDHCHALQVLDLDNGWLDHLDVGFDFSDILGADANISDDAMVPSTSCGLSQLMDDDFMVPDSSSHDDSRLQQDSLKRAFRQMGGECYDVEHSVLQTQYTCPLAFVPMSTSVPSTALEATPAGALPPRLVINQPVAVMYAPSFVMPQPLMHVTSMQAAINREQRVLRYREKRKNRKFEKTIRYASRKAYAEVRPRIKGRFAKKEELGSGGRGMWELDVGVVPQFSI